MRTRPLAEAAEDVRYIQEMSTAPETGQLRVHTAFPGIPGQSGATIIAEKQGQRDAVVANGVGEAVFSGLRPGEYSIHVASDGDLPADPKVQLNAKGCLDVSLFRALRITGRVMTKSGAPASRIQVQFRAFTISPCQIKNIQCHRSANTNGKADNCLHFDVRFGKRTKLDHPG